MIDKSLSYKYRAENRKGFFRGAQADTRSGQSMSPGTSASGGSRNGGGGGGGGDHHPPVYVAPVTTAVAPPSILAKEPPKDTRGDTPDRIAEQIILDEIRKKEKEKFEKDQDYMDLKAQAPTTLIPKTVTYDRGVPFTDTPIKTTVGQTLFDPRTSQNVLLKRGSGLGTLGKILLAGATAGAGAGLFGKDIATVAKLANYKKNYDRIQKSTLGKKLKLKELDFSNVKSTIQKGADLRSRPKGMPEHLGERGFRIRDDTPPRDGDGPKTIAEQVTQGAGLAEGQKMLGLDDKQIQQIYQGRDLLSTTIEAGVYQGRQLTAEQIKILQNKKMELNKLIEAIEKAQAPVNVAYGGRIDKALSGRSRDIG